MSKKPESLLTLRPCEFVTEILFRGPTVMKTVRCVDGG